MRRTTALATTFLLFVLCANGARAWIRQAYEDVTVCERSELIVVGHIIDGSVQYMPIKSGEDSTYMQFHAILDIKQVLKGKCAKKKIPIIIYHGLLPMVNGYGFNDSENKNYLPKGIIKILDEGSSAKEILPIKDAREDNLWFLRKLSGNRGNEPGNGNYGIVDPEDLQPLKWKSYYLQYLSTDPESAIRNFVKERTADSKDGQRYLDHLDVQHILTLKDPEQRYDLLLPIFLKRSYWNTTINEKRKFFNIAQEGLEGCGPLAGEKLKDVFLVTKNSELRQDIISIWLDIKYLQSLPILIELLKQHDNFWAEQKLSDNWQNIRMTEQEIKRFDIFYEDHYTVCALRKFRDARAREALEMTLKRWKAIKYDNTEIVDECEAALRELDQAGNKAIPNTPAYAGKP